MFERFWSAYPKRAGRQDAEREFAKLAVDDDLLTTMLDAIRHQQQQREWKADNGRYIPHPANWLSKRRWQDEVSDATSSTVQATIVDPDVFDLCGAASLKNRDIKEYLRTATLVAQDGELLRLVVADETCRGFIDRNYGPDLRRVARERGFREFAIVGPISSTAPETDGPQPPAVLAAEADRFTENGAVLAWDDKKRAEP
jgi:hypothetical protein